MLTKRFHRCEKVDLVEMSKAISDLMRILEMMNNKEIPNDTYTTSDLKTLCQFLVMGQRNRMRGLKPGSWCVAAHAEMPSDARVDFVFFLPTLPYLS